jgi:hypothetical protein
MYNPALAAAVTFDRKEFDEFIEKMGRSEAKTHDDEATLFQTQRKVTTVETVTRK